MKTIHCKLGNMRKEAEWVIYPSSTANDDNIRIIQSDKRIAKINLSEKTAVINSGKKGNTFLSLSEILGATEIVVPDDVIQMLKNG